MPHSSLPQAPSPISCCPSYTYNTVWKTELQLPIIMGSATRGPTAPFSQVLASFGKSPAFSCHGSSVPITPAVAQAAPQPLSLQNFGRSPLGSPPLLCPSLTPSTKCKSTSDFSQILFSLSQTFQPARSNPLLLFSAFSALLKTINIISGLG